RDGTIGSGASFTKSNLSVGVHTVTAQVTDSGGLTDIGSLTLTIISYTPPTVTITNPQDNENVHGPFTINAVLSGFEESTIVTFKVDGNVVFTDSTSPYVASLKTKDFSKGQHTIVVVANDGSNWSIDSIVFKR
ncbi:MAG: Ig-like domain-containing protein, partial [Nitrosopumilus sp.]|nr:Ig-like domain-containing protein [Nitrosopumilus sp.]